MMKTVFFSDHHKCRRLYTKENKVIGVKLKTKKKRQK